MAQRNHDAEDAARYAAAVDEFITTYRKGRRWHETSGPNRLFDQLASELRGWVAAGQKEGHQVRHSREELAIAIKLEGETVLGPNYLSTALTRIRRRLAKLSADDTRGLHSGASGVWLRISGPIHEDKTIWLDIEFIEPLDSRTPVHERRLPLSPLPALPLHFVGRTELIADISRRLTDAHRGLVGFFGDAFVGKTSVAVAVAEAIADRYPDSYFIALNGSRGGASDGRTLLRKVLGGGALGAEEDDIELRRRFRAALDGQRGVIIFDDVTRADAFTELAPPVGFVFIVTAHAKLPVPGVDWIEVPRLTPFESRELVERLGLFLPEDDTVGAIAAHCGGNPAALSEAATFLVLNAWDNPRSYASDLRSMEWGLLTSNAVADTPLKIACRQIYETVPHELKATYRLLGMFSGRFSFEAADAVLGASSQHELAPLIRCGALQFDDIDSTYRVPLIIRWHARSLITANDREMAAPRHAQHYAGLAKRTLEGDEFARNELLWSSLDLWEALSYTSYQAASNEAMAASYTALCRVLLPDVLPSQFHDADFVSIEDILLSNAQAGGNSHLAIAHATGWLLAGRRQNRADYLEKALSIAGNDGLIEQHALAGLVQVARNDLPHSAQRVAAAMVRAGEGQLVSSSSLRALEDAALLNALLSSRRGAIDALALFRHRARLLTPRTAAQRATHYRVRGIVELARCRWSVALRELRRAHRLRNKQDGLFQAQLCALASIAHAALGNLERARTLVNQASLGYHHDTLTGLAGAYACVLCRDYNGAARILATTFRAPQRRRDVRDELCEALAHFLHAYVLSIKDGPAAAIAFAKSADALLRQHGSRRAAAARRFMLSLQARTQDAIT